jgi:hypothetical protein
MSTSSFDDDVEALIEHLAYALQPSAKEPFRHAARSALAGIPCCGPGVAWRVLGPLQRRYFDPPLDRAYGPRPGQGGKLVADAEPVGRDDPRVGARDRRRFRAG